MPTTTERSTVMVPTTSQLTKENLQRQSRIQKMAPASRKSSANQAGEITIVTQEPSQKSTMPQNISRPSSQSVIKHRKISSTQIRDRPSTQASGETKSVSGTEETSRNKTPRKYLTYDPRTYVQRLAPPIASQKGLKIQARCATVYNPSHPTREMVRKVNYKRRQEQLATQGFNALNHKPYIGIGDPFYLDEKRLVLSALGQLNDSDDSYISSSSDDEDTYNKTTPSASNNKSMAAAKFMLRRKNKNLNNLTKEVNHGRNLIRHVKLGYGLFDLIKQEQNAKKAAIAKAYREKMEESRNAWQPPKSDSSDEDEDEYEKPEETELDSCYFSGEEAESVFLTQPKDRKGVGFSSEGEESARGGTSTPRRKKKNTPPRPFTPVYTSLSEVTDHTKNFETQLTNQSAGSKSTSPVRDEPSVVKSNQSNVSDGEKEISFDVAKNSLFRQLCVLNWILEAMNIEQGYSMAPITSCWKLTKSNIGGSKISTKKLQREKTAETRWDQFVTNTGQHSRVSKRSTGPRLSRQYNRRLLHVRTSIQSSSLSPSNSVHDLNVSNLTTHTDGAAVDETNPQTEPQDEELNATCERGEKGYFKSVSDEVARRVEADRQDKLADDTKSDDNSSPERHKRERRGSVSEGKTSRKAHRKKSTEKQERRESRLASACTTSTEDKKPTRQWTTNSTVIRPKSSPGLIEYQATLPSNKYGSLSSDLRTKFEEIQEFKALTLHDILQQMERERLNKCQTKFSAMRRPQSSIVHRALEDMREEGHRILINQSTEQLRKKSSFKGNWFTDLQESIPKPLQNLWYYNLILQKLSRYGLVENSSKQSVYQFIRTLGTLRHWEICSPDITAAVEFCREKIVEMTVEEFEEWFHQQFPSVVRPPTVFTSKKKEQKDQEFKATTKQSLPSRPKTAAVMTTTRA